MVDLIFWIGAVLGFSSGWLCRMLYKGMIDIQNGVTLSPTPAHVTGTRFDAEDYYATHPHERSGVVHSRRFPRLIVAGQGQVYCPRCGKSTDDSGRFCQWCGVNLEDESQ